MGRHDVDMLLNPDLNLSSVVYGPFISVAPDILLDDGDRLPFGGLHFEVIFTPGHTKGSICLKIGNWLFSGDTLFCRSIGRTDLPTGSLPELERSVRTKLYVLPDETRVYTGHGDPTTIGEEKKHNAFVRP